jgi:abortive infection bacteriophage resistance protein
MYDRAVKPPTTYEEQLKILKDRNLIIPSQIRAFEVLEKVNYYRLSAYFLTFKQEDDMFKEGTTFDKIYSLYEFDRKLRNLIMEQL